jgi:hypothetical protein
MSQALEWPIAASECPHAEIGLRGIPIRLRLGPVDWNRDAMDETGIVAGEEDNRSGEFFGLPLAAGRRQRRDLISHIHWNIQESSTQIGVDWCFPCNGSRGKP